MSQDIPSIAAISAFQQGRVAQQVSMAVEKKSLDATKAQGEAAISLLQAAVEVQAASLPDPGGKGGHIDVRG